MPYIGRDTDKISNVEKLDTLTFDGSSSYTLQKNSVDFVPTSANALLVSIDGVMQYGNFTISGSTIDFGVAIASTSTCDFVLHIGVGIITAPSDGSVTDAKLATSAINSQTAETSIADGDEILIYDTSASALRKMTKSNFVSGVDNTPAFQAYISSNQGSISSNTYTKVQFDTEFFDTDSCYDKDTNYRFTPTTAGKYFCYTAINNSYTAGSPDDLRCRFYFNGSAVSNLRETILRDYSGTGISLVLTTQVQAIITFNGSTDYLEVYARNDGTPQFSADSYFGAYKLIGV